MTRLSPQQIAEALGQHVPTEEQQAVITAPLAPQLVVAGAGSGKTETMSARVVFHIANGDVRADEVLGLTFTRKAAAELSDRVRLRLRQLRRSGAIGPAGAGGFDVDRPTIATYNSFAADIAKEHALRVGADPDTRLVTEAGAWQLADSVVQGWHDALDTDATPATVTEVVLSLSGALSEHLLSTDDAREQLTDLVDSLTAIHDPSRKAPYADTVKVVAALRERIAVLDVVDAYTRAKRDRGVMDFGDQVALAARIAVEVPAVGAALREQYRLVLLDEYQDTSVAQLRLLATIFGDGHPVTAVGDPNQAIYGWRGAAAAALAEFPDHFPSLGRAGQQRTPTRYLRTSWRNETAVLDVANAISAPLRVPDPASRAPHVDVPELVPRPGAERGQVLAGYPAAAAEEATGVADFFARWWRPGTTSTAAVLCRARSQFGAVVAALEERGVPVEVVGLGGLLFTPEIVDLRAALEAAHDAARGDSVMRLLTSARVGPRDLHVLAAWARHLAGQEARGESSLVEAVDHPPEPSWRSPGGASLSPAGADRVRRTGDLLRQLRSASYLSLPELVSHAITLMGLDIEVAARAGRSRAHARADLDAFVDVAAGFAADADGAQLGAFLGWLDVADKRERGLEPVDSDPEPGAVQVLTIHAAKGLEWDVVAVTGLVESQFPSYAGAPKNSGAVSAAGWLTDRRTLPYPLRGDEPSLPLLDLDGAGSHADVRDALLELRRAVGTHAVAEERRLAYVAVTRAKHTLLLTGSWFRAGKKPLPPSRFVAGPRDLGLVEDLDGALAWTEPPPADATNPDLEEAQTAAWPFDPLGARRDRTEMAAAAVRGVAPDAATEPPPADPDVRRWLRDTDLLLRERASSGAPELDVGLGSHLSASAAVGLAGDPQAFALDRRRPMPTAPSEHAAVGNLFHAWVEEFYGAPSLLDLDADAPPAGTGGAGNVPDLAALKRTFEASPWAARTPVAIEVDLETPVAGTVIRCRIDAVFDDDLGTHVVDWKTGAPPRDETALAQRELQLALYRLAWARHTGTPLDDVHAAFYFVAPDLTVEAGRLTEEQIEARLLEAVARAGSPAPG
ncbi:ATP-dependent DNA helicase [Georgenia sp. MJ173]|uniref:ATP-dependent helicase n=1 Tax=Georgenia sunbinii TaxID=3117728 RepID=UPI002F26A3C0